MSIPSVSVGLRKGRIFIIPTFSPGPGTYIDNEPVTEALPTDPEQIGTRVLEGLSNFRDGGEMPDWTTYRSPVLSVAGVKSWDEYEKGLIDCVIDVINEKLRIRSEQHDLLEIDANARPDELGIAVLVSLGKVAGKLQ